MWSNPYYATEWEGWGSEEAEPEELPNQQSPHESTRIESIRFIVPASDGEGDFERNITHENQTFCLWQKAFLLWLKTDALTYACVKLHILYGK